MHKNVLDYCLSIKNKFPESFKDKKVLEVGSLDINGSVRQFFENCDYTGIDLGEGPGVDEVLDICDIKFNTFYDTVISTEMLEHCYYYKKALENMTDVLKSGGLLLLTAAGEGRAEHGTTRSSPKSAPYTNDYYKNIVESDFDCIINDFSEYEISKLGTDIRFYGVKK